MIETYFMSGFTDAESLNDNATATSGASFAYAFTGTTTITWGVSVTFDGPYGSVLLDLGGLTEGYQGAATQSWEGTITQTLGPGVLHVFRGCVCLGPG
jgi:hypothetical protein